MNQRELSILLSQHIDTSQSLANSAIYTLTAILTAALQHGECVSIDHLGTFSTVWIPPRNGNPGGRGVRPFEGRWVVRFKPAQRLQKALRDFAQPPKAD